MHHRALRNTKGQSHFNLENIKSHTMFVASSLQDIMDMNRLMILDYLGMTVFV